MRASYPGTPYHTEGYQSVTLLKSTNRNLGRLLRPVHGSDGIAMTMLLRAMAALMYIILPLIDHAVNEGHVHRDGWKE